MKILGLEPCPLCITQQFLYCVVGLSAFIAYIHNPKLYTYKIYSGVILFVSAFGSWVAGRQLWLQGLPEDQVPLCGPPLEYILEVFPLFDVINTLFMGDGNCAEITWQFLGLSMAGWSLIFFILFMFLSVVVIFKSYSAYR